MNNNSNKSRNAKIIQFPKTIFPEIKEEDLITEEELEDYNNYAVIALKLFSTNYANTNNEKKVFEAYSQINDLGGSNLPMCFYLFINDEPMLAITYTPLYEVLNKEGCQKNDIYKITIHHLCEGWFHIEECATEYLSYPELCEPIEYYLETLNPVLEHLPIDEEAFFVFAFSQILHDRFEKANLSLEKRYEICSSLFYENLTDFVMYYDFSVNYNNLINWCVAHIQEIEETISNS